MTGSGKATSEHLLRVHALLPESCSNGPGRRSVVWLQGCSLKCSGCFNPAAKPRGGGRLITAAQLAATMLADRPRVEGVTISGGEPLDQAGGLLALLRCLRDRGTRSIILFSGFTLAEIQRLPGGPQVLALCDVLIDGRYDRTCRQATGMRGSANQRIHLLSSRHTLEQIEQTPAGEVIIAHDGSVRVTGVAPLDSPTRDASASLWPTGPRCRR
jgi:anaerobic ribonucleoside-triphosphate reductase activating protein